MLWNKFGSQLLRLQQLEVLQTLTSFKTVEHTDMKRQADLTDCGANSTLIYAHKSSSFFYLYDVGLSG